MTSRRPDGDEGLDPRVEAWLDDGPDRAPAAFVEATLAPIPVMAQRRRSLVAFGRMTVTLGALGRMAAAAALVVVVATLGSSMLRVDLAGHGGETPTPAPAGSATPAPLPSGVTYTNAGPLGVGSGGESGKAGTYQTLLFRPAMRFTVPARWSVTNLVNTFVGGGEDASGIPIGNGTGVIVVTAPTTVDPPAPGEAGSAVPADLLAWLVSDPQLTLAGNPKPVTIAGIAGREIEGSLAASARLDPVDGFYRPFDHLPLLPRHHFRIAVLDVAGRQVVVATLANADVFESFRPEADGVIGSFAFVGG